MSIAGPCQDPSVGLERPRRRANDGSRGERVAVSYILHPVPSSSVDMLSHAPGTLPPALGTEKIRRRRKKSASEGDEKSFASTTPVQVTTLTSLHQKLASHSTRGEMKISRQWQDRKIIPACCTVRVRAIGYELAFET